MRHSSSLSASLSSAAAASCALPAFGAGEVGGSCGAAAAGPPVSLWSDWEEEAPAPRAAPESGAREEDPPGAWRAKRPPAEAEPRHWESSLGSSHAASLSALSASACGDPGASQRAIP